MFTQLTSADFTNTLESCEKGLCLCFKKLCPHCKNMEKVLAKFNGLMPDVQLYTLDIEEEDAIADTYDAKRAPTLLVMSNGEVKAVKSGLMNPKELKAFVQSALK